MVISAECPSRPPDPPAPPPPTRHSNLLHNFSFPTLKTWGTQRLLRCSNVNRNREIAAADRRITGDDSRSRIGPLPEVDDEEDSDRDLEEVREKLMQHLREAADRMELAVGAPAREKEEPEAVAMPWSLRPRRAGTRVSFAVERDLSPRPPLLSSRSAPSRPRFSLTLSKEEIEEDIYAMTGSLPRRRPRKRPRAVQKQLDALFPGGWLSEITVESYKHEKLVF